MGRLECFGVSLCRLVGHSWEDDGPSWGSWGTVLRGLGGHLGLVESNESQPAEILNTSTTSTEQELLDAIGGLEPNLEAISVLWCILGVWGPSEGFIEVLAGDLGGGSRVDRFLLSRVNMSHRINKRSSYSILFGF